MSHIGTFGSFGQARLAIYAAQLGLSVTGNNISNVNTVGYTRQRLDQVSFKTGGADRYQSATDVRIGNGVLPTGVSQLRDPYLDIRYRTENANVGAMDTKLNGLNQIAAILDEVGKGGEVPEGEQFGIVAYQLGNLFKALSALTAQTGQKEYDVQVRSSAASLCQELNSYATQLEKLYNNTVESYNENITKVNNLLTNIRDLNASIRECDIHGDNALELRDQRNNLIDTLSGYLKISVSYTTEDIGAGKSVEKLLIHLDNANPDKSVHTDESLLVDGRYCTQLMTKKPVLNTLEDFPYVKEGGGYTANPEEAVKAPRLNPDFKEDQAVTDPNFRYLDADNKPVEKAEDAAQDPVARTDTTSLRYVKAGVDGGFTNNLAEAASDPKLNPNYNPNDPDHSYQYLDEDGNPTNNTNPILELNTGADKEEKPYLDQDGNPTAQKPAMWVPKENPDYQPYLQKDGTPTKELDDAQMVDLPNFGIQLSELKDKHDRILESVVKMEERALNPGETYSKDAISTLLPDGTTKITTYRSVQQWTLKKNAVYDEKADFAKDFPNATEGPDPANTAHAKYFKYVTIGKDADGKEVQSLTNNYKEAAREVTTVYFATDYIKTPSTVVELDDNDLLGIIQSQRELLTESGEFSSLDTIAQIDEKAGIKRGIPYYQNVLDLLANQIATAFNNANQGYMTDSDGTYITAAVDPKTGETVGTPLTFETTTQDKDAAGNLLFDENGKPIMKKVSLTADTKWEDIPDEIQLKLMEKDPTIDSVQAYLERGGGKGADGEPVPVGIFRGGNLFSVNGNTNDDTEPDGTPINASNISVSKAWTEGPLIVNSFVCAPGKTEPETTHDYNILTMQGLQYAKLEYLPQVFAPDAQKDPMFTGTFQEMFRNVSTILGNDQQITSTLLDNYYEETTELDSSRANVSSVDFNDEAMNLMQYSKSYNAACRLMTTLDSVLDKLINGTGMTT